MGKETAQIVEATGLRQWLPASPEFGHSESVECIILDIDVVVAPPVCSRFCFRLVVCHCRAVENAIVVGFVDWMVLLQLSACLFAFFFFCSCCFYLPGLCFDNRICANKWKRNAHTSAVIW